jgi:hypothetical protein
MMLREQMINFLEAAIVFLLATNAASALATLYAMRFANAVSAAPLRANRGQRTFA